MTFDIHDYPYNPRRTLTSHNADSRRLACVTMRLLADKSPLSLDEIQSILNSPIPYTKHVSENEAIKCEELLKTLNEEQVEFAAQSSFAYYLASFSDVKPTLAQRVRMATRECRRHLFKVELESATKQMHDTVTFRKDRGILHLRAIFLDCIELETDEEKSEVERMRQIVLKEVVKQKSFVRGQDKKGRAILILDSRTQGCDSDDDFLLTQIYMMERAIATSESLTLGREEKIMAVFNFGNFYASTAPSLHASKRLASTFQGRYPERLKKLVVIDAPFWMRTMYKMIQPFVDPETRSKFIMAKGSDEKFQNFEELVDEGQAMPFMLPSGQLVEPVDMDIFLFSVPFNSCYDREGLPLPVYNVAASVPL